jgi:hypothetical protein
MLNEYANDKWFEFRKEIMELDGFTCVRCGRKESEGAVLQVHHKKYIQHKPIWDYPLKLCETLCRGCHAAEHGIIMPQEGWDFIMQVDLGGLAGKCERCGTEIRYTFYIDHPRWAPMIVGTICCDNLTKSKTASSLQRKDERLQRFLSSTRWVDNEGISSIKQKGLNIEILDTGTGYKLHIQEVEGSRTYKSIDDAKKRVFNFIDSGEASDFFL